MRGLLKPSHEGLFFFTTFAINNRKSGFLIILEFDEIIN